MNFDKLLNTLGLDTPRWHWRIMRWKRLLRSIVRNDAAGGGFSTSQLIIVINVVLFVLMVVNGVVAGLGLSPIFAPPTELLLAWGGQFWPAVFSYGQWWRCLTYAFTHGGVIHLAFNMIVLYQVGPLVESEIGRSRFVVLYTLTALTGTFAGYLWHPYTPVVGASTSLFGLIGFSIVYYHRLGPNGVQLRDFMLKWAIFAFLFGLVVGADNAGHLGGAIGGAAFGAILPQGYGRRRKFAKAFDIMAILSAVSIMLSLFSLFYWVITA